MKPKPSQDLSLRILNYSLVIISVAYLIGYFILALIRISYPYELEWMEGCSVDHVSRVLSGQQLYVEPSIEFVPYIYTPLYFFVGAIVSKLLGVGFLSLRLTSVLASLGCFILIFEFVKKETKSIFLAILSAGLFAATYRVSGAWFDIARVDTLFMVFLLWSVFLLRFYHSALSLLLAGLLISLSFLTKQTALLIAGPMCIYCFLCVRGKSKYIFPSVVAVIVGFSSIILNQTSNGWYYYYVFELPRQHQIVHGEFSGFWQRDIFYLSIALCISLTYLVSLLCSRRWKDFVFYALFFISMVVASWSSRLHSGGYANVLFPAYGVISILFGLGAHVLTSSVLKNTQHREADSLNIKILYKCCFAFICLYQFLTLLYNPLDQLPTKEDYYAGKAFIQMLKDIEGDVYVQFHGFLPSLAGKKTYAHIMPLYDVIRGHDRDKEKKLKQELINAIHNKKFDAIILDGDWMGVAKVIEKNYPLRYRVFYKEKGFWPVTGKKTRPQVIYKLAK